LKRVGELFSAHDRVRTWRCPIVRAHCRSCRLPGSAFRHGRAGMSTVGCYAHRLRAQSGFAGYGAHLAQRTSSAVDHPSLAREGPAAEKERLKGQRNNPVKAGCGTPEGNRTCTAGRDSRKKATRFIRAPGRLRHCPGRSARVGLIPASMRHRGRRTAPDNAVRPAFHPAIPRLIRRTADKLLLILQRPTEDQQDHGHERSAR
jgi:hypothetical protein